MLMRWMVAVAVLATGMTGLARADAVEDFYKGKTITMIVSYGPGGGYDIYGRILAQHMSKHIPGKPTIIINNMPGAGSLKGANYIYNVAPKDGAAFGIFARNIPLLALRLITDTPTQPFPAPPDVLFDIQQQRTHITALARFFLTHPTRIPGLVRFARRIARARKTLAIALVNIVRRTE